MSPKKKDVASSSDSSSSSSSSTSSSSSSSASDSSSSDSENTTTSGKSGGGNRSTDSEKKPTPKKRMSTSSNRSKNETLEEKNKDKNKRQPQKPIFTSDSDDSSPKQSSKRKPQAKPKSSATVTPVPKTTPKSSNPKTVTKKVNPPRKVAQKVALKENLKTKDEKKSKTKSIFSPDNSSDSETTSTPPPPKLTAMKNVAAKAHKAKPKPKPAPKRASSVSSNSSDSSRSSRSSSSSPESSRSKVIETKKVNSVKKEKKISPPRLNSDNEAPSRKQTRSSSMRKSKHVMSRLASDSDSDASKLSKSPVKKASKNNPIHKSKPKSSNSSESSHLVEEERKCPLENCDSNGHLGGRLEKHFTLEACPKFHNMTPQQCREAYSERMKKEEERKKSIAVLKHIHSITPTPEQKLYRDKVKEVRNKFVPTKDEHHHHHHHRHHDHDSDIPKDKQPDLSKYCNKYDLKIFQEAQAVASEIIEDELKLLANVHCTKCIEMGKFEMEVWYQSPYPDNYARLPKLYICEYCLRYMGERMTLERHVAKCVWRHPPGEEVYRKEKISVFEVDGKKYKTYCQNLCLLAKFFLDHKTLYYDVEPFLFYVMTISDSEGCHTVGYFSKEKNSFLNYNVSCILTLPPYQRQGYGRLLIDFSYLLTRVEGKIGSPEKPLSDLGLISYRSYWKDVLLEYLCNLGGKQLSIKDISQEMAINSYDIVSTLQALGMMKYWKGKHIILKKQDVIEEYIERSKRRGVTYKEIDPECLKWTPFVPPDNPAANT